MATPKQIAFGKKLGLSIDEKLPTGKASRLISQALKKRRADNFDRAMSRRDTRGRLHGWQPTFGTGGIHYNHGRIDFCDDGNGNVYDGEDYGYY